jgi:Outer membrane protein beta-barrel domain
MNRLAKLTLACGATALGALGLGTTASADNLLGLYAGVGVGESTVRSDNGFDPYYPDDSHPHHTAYKAIVGIRPIPFIGAEVEYLDFGHSSSADSYDDRHDYYGADNTADSHPKAGILYAVGYLPLPFVDIFVKGGVARLETNINTYDAYSCTPYGSGPGCDQVLIGREHAWQTKAAYGAGVQGHISHLNLRAEYERINSSFGDPDAFMVSATWTF